MYSILIKILRYCYHSHLIQARGKHLRKAKDIGWREIPNCFIIISHHFHSLIEGNAIGVHNVVANLVGGKMRVKFIDLAVDEKGTRLEV